MILTLCCVSRRRVAPGSRAARLTTSSRRRSISTSTDARCGDAKWQGECGTNLVANVGWGTCVDSPLLEARKTSTGTNQTEKKKKKNTKKDTREQSGVDRKDLEEHTGADTYIRVLVSTTKARGEKRNERETARHTTASKRLTTVMENGGLRFSRTNTTVRVLSDI